MLSLHLLANCQLRHEKFYSLTFLPSKVQCRLQIIRLYAVLDRFATTVFCLEISCISLGCEAYALITFYESEIVIIMLSKYISYPFIPMTAKFALLKPPLAKNNGAYLCLSILVTSFGVELQVSPVIQDIPCKSTRLC